MFQYERLIDSKRKGQGVIDNRGEEKEKRENGVLMRIDPGDVISQPPGKTGS